MKQYEIQAFGRWWPLHQFKNLDGRRLLVAECPFVASFPVRRLHDQLVRGVVRKVAGQ